MNWEEKKKIAYEYAEEEAKKWWEAEYGPPKEYKWWNIVRTNWEDQSPRVKEAYINAVFRLGFIRFYIEMNKL